MTISGKVVAVTGASSGMGEATALMLANQGARLILGARRPDRLKALAARIASEGGEALYLPVDVSRRGDVESFVALACDRFGALDVLVSNAGAMPIAPLDDLDVEGWDEMIDVNIKGLLYGIAAALPRFRRQGFGQFVNIASTAARKVVPNQAVYAGTKAAVLAISDGLRQEIGPKLRVTVISPGFTATEFAQQIRNPSVKRQLESSRDEFAMSPDAVARAVAFAISQPAEVNVGEIVVRSTAQP